jgi:hypothetical protein
MCGTIEVFAAQLGRNRTSDSNKLEGCIKSLNGRTDEVDIAKCMMTYLDSKDATTRSLYTNTCGTLCMGTHYSWLNHFKRRMPHTGKYDARYQNKVQPILQKLEQNYALIPGNMISSAIIKDKLKLWIAREQSRVSQARVAQVVAQQREQKREQERVQQQPLLQQRPRDQQPNESSSSEENNNLPVNSMPVYKDIRSKIVSPKGPSDMFVLNLHTVGDDASKLGARVRIQKKENVYFFHKGLELNDMDMPFLLMTKQDFETYEKYVHKDAFAQGFRQADPQEFTNIDQSKSWYMVWNIPGDLNSEKGWVALQNVNSGKSSIAPAGAFLDENLPQEMTKVRHDFPCDHSQNYDPIATSVHHLQDGNRKLAMITSDMFFQNVDQPTQVEQKLIKIMIEYFRKIDIKVWHAPDQHAIVFNVTPGKLSGLLHKTDDSSPFGAILKAALGPLHYPSLRDDLLSESSPLRVAGRGHQRVMHGNGGPILTPRAIHIWRVNFVNKYKFDDF